MKKILILTVGGSPEPIINAVKFYRPDFVYFVCSSGPKGSAVFIDSPGDPCGDKRKVRCPECGHEFNLGNPKGEAIVFQAGLDKDSYKTVNVDDPDDLNQCYFRLMEISKEIKEKYPDSEVIANYTGGTKTMSVALALVSVMIQDWDLSVNKGPRLDTIKVKAGDTPVLIDKWQIFCEQRLRTASRSLRNYDYAMAEQLIGEALMNPLRPEFEKKLLQIKQICSAFNLWDRFDHSGALDILQAYGKYYSDYIIVLKEIMKKTKSSGYELVADLINNAERKACQARYDDAIARLYRATELFAQIRLKTIKGFELGKIKIQDLPEELAAEYEPFVKSGDQIMLGLREDYELLYKLGDETGEIYNIHEKKILHALNQRNKSIFAHGLVPMQEKDYKLVSKILINFIFDAANKISISIEQKQLPGAEIIKNGR